MSLFTVKQVGFDGTLVVGADHAEAADGRHAPVPAVRKPETRKERPPAPRGSLWSGMLDTLTLPLRARPLRERGPEPDSTSSASGDRRADRRRRSAFFKPNRMIRMARFASVLSALTALAVAGCSARAGQAPRLPSARLAVDAPAPAEAFSLDASAVVATALALQGRPYVFGGTTPAGFDASGFTHYVYARHGIDLPRVAARQYRAGAPVDRPHLQPGDLVFFNRDTPGPSHVGLLVGDGRFVYASAAVGEVRVDRLDGSYWRSRYAGARRVVASPPRSRPESPRRVGQGQTGSSLRRLRPRVPRAPFGCRADRASARAASAGTPGAGSFTGPASRFPKSTDNLGRGIDFASRRLAREGASRFRLAAARHHLRGQHDRTCHRFERPCGRGTLPVDDCSGATVARGP